MQQYLVKAGVDYVVGDGLEVIWEEESGLHKGAQVLISHHVPDPIARQHQKLIIFLSPFHVDLWLGWHQLLTGTFTLNILPHVIIK